MSIKKKLTISNIAMILIPVVFFLVIFQISTTILNTYKQNPPNEIRNANALMDMAGAGDKIDATIKFCSKLESQGAYIKLMKDDQVVYLSKDFDVQKQAKGNDVEKLNNVKQLIFSNEKGSEIYSRGLRENHLITLDILSDKPVAPEMTRKDFEEEAELFRTLLIGLFLLTVVIIAITNGMLTTFISRSILTPLGILHEGTNQIKQGNLDHQVVYDKQDEFGMVCADFEEMRRRLKESVLEQQRYEESRKELIAGISHDLGTPLTTIKGYVSGILDGVANTPEKTEMYLRTINSTADSMRRMVDNLFLFSKLDINSIPFYFDQVNLIDYFKSYCQEIKNDLHKREMDLIFTTECRQALVMLDVMQFERAVFNILDNSVKYKKAGQGTITISIKEQEECFWISFQDDGRGVAQEDVGKIFDIFYRTDRVRGETDKGSGLGLAIVHQIVSFHKGKVWAKSELGKGLQIVISLPKAEGLKAV
ncbi:MAG: HAMP domain-containing histidine kinase [Peptococcaceae bacterium]|nr:HAMP domain-containing histidine kinase [Peptococcaceae bacterium]